MTKCTVYYSAYSEYTEAMLKDFVEADVIKDIKAIVEKSGLRVTARRMGMSASYLSDIIWRRRNISAKVAKTFGYAREKITVVVFRKEG